MTPRQLITKADAHASATVKPEYGPLPRKGHDPITGPSRSMCYILEKAGFIRLVRIRLPGNTLGRVLIDYESVRAYFAKRAGKHAGTAASPA